jgi:hypothetical protein
MPPDDSITDERAALYSELELARFWAAVWHAARRTRRTERHRARAVERLRAASVEDAALRWWP